MNLLAGLLLRALPAILLALAGTNARAQVAPHQGQLEGLQALIDRAAPGAIVFVPSGDYRASPVTLRQSITLIGATPSPKLGRVSLVGTSGTVTIANMTIDHFYYPDLTLGMFDEFRLQDVLVTIDGFGGWNHPYLAARNYIEAVRVRVADPVVWLTASPGQSVFLDCQAAGLYGPRVFTNDPTIPVSSLFPVRLPDDLHMRTLPRLGGTFALAWTVPGPVARLIGQTATQAPIDAPGSGYWHLAGARWLDVAVASPGGITIQVPTDAALVGTTAAFQVVGEGMHFSRPVSALVLP